MELQADPVKEVFGELFSLLEAQETQSAAVLQFLMDQGIATEEKLAPYLEQAGNGSNVKWRAARKRMEYLLTPIQKDTDSNKEPDKNKNAEQMKVEGASLAPVDPKLATQQKEQNNKEKDADKAETEIAASAKAASASAAPKAGGNATTQKTAEGASEDPEDRKADKIQESKEQAAR